MPGFLQLATILPADLSVTVTLIQQKDLHRAAQAVQLTDKLSLVLIPAIPALGLAGLLLAPPPPRPARQL